MTCSQFDRYLALTKHHKKNCSLYAHYVGSLFPKEPRSLAQLPYLPVSLFKSYDLRSVAQQDVFKVMHSSGTTGQPSKVYLDKSTAKAQSSALADSFKSFFGNSRLPMLVIDCESTARGRTARTAAINGFSLFGKKRCFALDDDLTLNLARVKAFLTQHQGSKVFIFGFTFMVYQHLLAPLEQQGSVLDLSNAFLLHGGGWKKLDSLNIADAQFKSLVAARLNCQQVHNYYGMIEQTGSIYFECEYGHLHAPDNGAVLIRSLDTLAPNAYGERGLIQVFSTIQESYPGHSLLTDDIGTCWPASQCACHHQGDILQIHGRLPQAEIRGCSDAV